LLVENEGMMDRGAPARCVGVACRTTHVRCSVEQTGEAPALCTVPTGARDGVARGGAGGLARTAAEQDGQPEGGPPGWGAVPWAWELFRGDMDAGNR